MTILFQRLRKTGPQFLRMLAVGWGIMFLVFGGCQPEPPTLMGNWQIVEMYFDGQKLPPEKLGNTYLHFREDSSIVSYALGDSTVDKFSVKGDSIVGSGAMGSGAVKIAELQEKLAWFEGFQDGRQIRMKAVRKERIPKQ
jgi:hypothetical protein